MRPGKQTHEGLINVLVPYYTGYNFTEDSRKDLDSSILTYHRITEAFKFAYAYRALLGDEDHWNVTEVMGSRDEMSWKF